ncbi:hypothetical protein Plec18170_008584 [Paecilomyces lecythidis]
MSTIPSSAAFGTQSNFEEIQASRPEFRRDASVSYVKQPKQDWKQGDGPNDGGECLKKDQVEIDPYEADRPSTSNYKLVVSGMVPRPITLISTRSKDGKTVNLAPFSYCQVINHDPPLYVVGFVGSLQQSKDTLRNIHESGECVLNMVSEHFVEAANATALGAPYGVSEWEISGLHQAPSSTVKPARVKEAILSVEGKLLEFKEFESRQTPGKKTGVMVTIEATRFWVREDAINENKDVVNLDVLKPISRLGGTAYGRTTEVIEIPRPEFWIV